MDIEALGKILGMAMAYGISFMGLVLAYYNYRKRTIKAEKVFTGTALAVFIPSSVLVLAVLIGAVWLALSLPKVSAEVAMTAVLPESSGAGGKVMGIAIPAVILMFSFWVTWALYRHFTKQMEEGGTDEQ
jgi:sterol desaturase/sphingolipid hydroxylase (fatty acid hydroxylase superfamily)